MSFGLYAYFIVPYETTGAWALVREIGVPSQGRVVGTTQAKMIRFGVDCWQEPSTRAAAHVPD